MAGDETLTSQGRDGETQTPASEPETPSQAETLPTESQAPETDVDYKEKFAASTREFQRLQQERQNERQQYEQQLALLNHALSQRQQAAAQQVATQTQSPQPVHSQADLASVLTPEERAEWKKAKEELNSDADIHYQLLATDRVASQRQQNLLSTLNTEAQYYQGVNTVTAELSQAPEFSDADAAREVLSRAVQIQNDPNMNTRIPYGEWAIAPNFTVNPYAVDRALLEYRARKGGARQQAKQVANETAHVDIGASDGPESAGAGQPTAGFSLDYLSETEKSAVRKVMTDRGFTDFRTAAKNLIWDTKSDAEKKKRQKEGPPKDSERSKTLWSSRNR